MYTDSQTTPKSFTPEIIHSEITQSQELFTVLCCPLLVNYPGNVAYVIIITVQLVRKALVEQCWWFDALLAGSSDLLRIYSKIPGPNIYIIDKCETIIIVLWLCLNFCCTVFIGNG